MDELGALVGAGVPREFEHVFLLDGDVAERGGAVDDEGNRAVSFRIQDMNFYSCVMDPDYVPYLNGRFEGFGD